MPDDAATPVVVFDLDGTVLSVNSFPHWVLFLIAGRMPGIGLHRRAQLSLRCLTLLLRRKLARLPHDDFLWRLQSAARAAGDTADAQAAFEIALMRHVRPGLTAALELVADQRIDAVLATAAAEDYARGLGRRLGFQHVLATPSGRAAGEPCNVGAHKRAQVLRFLADNGWSQRPLILFTDHLDDLPLMRDSSVVYWCGSPGDMRSAADQATDALFVPCLELDMAALAARLVAACQCAPLRVSARS